MNAADRYRYVKVSFTDRRPPIFLAVTQEGARFISGIRVNQNGEEMVRKGIDRQIHMIEKSAEVVKSIEEYREDLKYGTLEPLESLSK